jgi:hypothetical protein
VDLVPDRPAHSGAPAEFLPRPDDPIADQLGVDVNGLRTPPSLDAPAADRRSPVLLLCRAGSSPASSAIAEELASHGYVVVGVNHTYETAVTVFSDGRVAAMNPAALGGALGPQIGRHEAAFRRRAEVCNYKAADLRFVADHLSRLAPNRAGLTAGHLDLTSLGAFGHSFGGNAALEWCRADQRSEPPPADRAIWTQSRSGCPPRPQIAPPRVRADRRTPWRPGSQRPAWRRRTDAGGRLAHLDRLRSQAHRTHRRSTMSLWTSRSSPCSQQPVAGMLAAPPSDQADVATHQRLALAFFAEHLDDS